MDVNDSIMKNKCPNEREKRETHKVTDILLTYAYAHTRLNYSE